VERVRNFLLYWSVLFVRNICIRRGTKFPVTIDNARAGI